MKLLVIGGSGQIGKAFRELAPDAVFLTRQELDLSRPSEIQPALTAHWNPSSPFDAVINTAAYTQVDLAEKEADLAFAVNCDTVRELGLFCAAHKIPLVHFSTDYVFEGSGTRPWTELDPVNPQNAYGRSKLGGELELTKIQREYPEFQFLTFRTSWVYDASGKNFFRTMLRLASEREEIRVVSDQIGAPCFAGDLAKITLECLTKGVKIHKTQGTFPSGVYHLCHLGEVSWYGFAKQIFEHAKDCGRTHTLPLKLKSALPISSQDYPTPAKRPLNSRLSTDKIRATFEVSLPTWEEGLAQCFSEFEKSLSEKSTPVNRHPSTPYLSTKEQ